MDSRNNINKQKEWLAAYLYYAAPWEEFLVRGLKPFVKQALEAKWAAQYFFIRYWEKGPHMRLRFKSDKDTIKKTLKPELKKYFQSYFRNNPSRRKKTQEGWVRNNCIRFVPYEPEYARYGGELGVEIAERQFEASSNAVLAAISAGKNWSYQRALGTALQLHLALASAYRLKPSQVADFFRFYTNHRLPKKNKKKLLDAYEKSYQQQRDKLDKQVQTLWDIMQEKKPIKPDWIAEWISQNSLIYAELTEANNNGKLTLHPCKCLTGKPPIWALYESYVHMTNNRLGVRIQDEAFIAYLLSKTIHGKSISPES